MQRKSWAAVLAAAGMAVLIGSVAGSQDEEILTCEGACDAAEQQCYENCQEADDVDTCEQKCSQETEACLEGCPPEQ